MVDILIQNPDNSVTGFSRSKKIERFGFQHIHFDFSDIDSLILASESFFPPIAHASNLILINNAANLGQIAYVGHQNTESFKKIFEVNTIALAILINTVLKQYKHNQSQKIIINISSGAASYPMDGMSGYSSSKAALEMISKTVALENGSNKGLVKIYAVAPGIVDTAMQDEIRQADSSQFSASEKFKGYKEDGHLTSPEKVASTLMKIIENPENYKEVIMDIRNIH